MIITLLKMLKLEKYSLSNKAIIAYVCADIGIKDALQDIDKLRKESIGQSFENQILSLAHQALLRGITVNELVYENHGMKMT